MLDKIIKENFTINELENFSGIKAHTIRIWEKRYNLLTPNRKTNNTRTYNLEQLKKLLNVAILISYGNKISKISLLSDSEIENKISTLPINNNVNPKLYNLLKIATIEVDHTLFEKTYETLLKSNTFTDIYEKYFSPLLYEVGLQWQTNKLFSIQEHFISNLIRQKIFSEINNIKYAPTSPTNFLLFLPHSELHEIPLLFAYYNLKKNNLRTTYIGENTYIEELHIVKKTVYIFVSSWITTQSSKEQEKHLFQISKILAENKNSRFWLITSLIISPKITSIIENNPQIILIDKISSFNELINQL